MEDMEDMEDKENEEDGPHCEIDDAECSGDVTQGCYLGWDLWFCQGHRT